MKHEAGKGDKRRPSFVTDEEYASNWERAFGKPTAETQIESPRCYKCGRPYFRSRNALICINEECSEDL